MSNTQQTIEKSEQPDVVRQSGWERWHDWQAVVMAPVTSWICEAIDARPGLRVLDAACGTGLPALAIAERLGHDGRLVATDISPIMVEAARRRAHDAGLRGVEVREAGLESLGLADSSFDAITCKDGIMYCADPVAGARELRRVLRPGGCAAITAWASPAQCAFFRTMFETVGRFIGAPSDPRAPGPFRVAAPGALEAVLRDAGFREVTVETREVTFTFDSLEMHWDVIRDMAAPVAAAAAKLGEAGIVELRTALAEAVAPFTDGRGHIALPNVAQCARALR